MKKSDLKDGMVVETRENKLYVVHVGCIKGLYSLCSLDLYDENLSNEPFDGLDIMKVYSTKKAKTITDMLNKKYLTLIWERKEYPLITAFQHELLVRMINEYGWLARDKDGYLCAYENKPHRVVSRWGDDLCGSYIVIPTILDDFNFIKWEDESPVDVQELLDNCEVKD